MLSSPRERVASASTSCTPWVSWRTTRTSPISASRAIRPGRTALGNRSEWSRSCRSGLGTAQRASRRCGRTWPGSRRRDRTSSWIDGTRPALSNLSAFSARIELFTASSGQDPRMTSQTDTVAADLDDTEIETPPAAPFTRFAAEFLGTFALVFIGFGATLYSGVLLNPDESLRLLSWGVALLVVIALFGHVSGGHFNPAVTLGSAITGRTSWSDVLDYWVGQLLGGAAAAGLLYVTIPSGLATAVGAASQKEMFTKNASGFGEHSVVGQLTTGAVTTEVVQVLLIEKIGRAHV